MESQDRRQSKTAGLPPGALIHIGRKKTDQVKLSLFQYDTEDYEEIACKNVEECLAISNVSEKVYWLNLDGIHEVEWLQKIGRAFDLHPLLLEDVLNTLHRPKLEEFDDYILVIIKMLGLNKTGDRIVAEQVSMVLGNDFLLSFQEQEGDLFGKIRDRIRNNKGMVRKKQEDYLLLILIDAIVDNYFLIIEHLSERIEKMEEKVLSQIDEHTLVEIQGIKKQLIQLKRSVFPLREVVSWLIKGDSKMIRKANGAYLRDIYDHTIHIIEAIETQRDLVAGLKDLYMSELSNKMNNVMKVLTIIATIFIPLTFIAGIYGMNFEYMPELKWRWAYPTAWLVMVLVTLVMIFYFKRKKWL